MLYSSRLDNNRDEHYIVTAWQNRQNSMCAQRRLRSAWHSPRLIRVFAVCMKNAWVLSSYLLSALQRLWSDWAEAQAGLSVRYAHMPFCRFCCALAHNLGIKEIAPTCVSNGLLWFVSCTVCLGLFALPLGVIAKLYLDWLQSPVTKYFSHNSVW